VRRKQQARPEHDGLEIDPFPQAALQEEVPQQRTRLAFIMCLPSVEARRADYLT
jgi:hypothetical protein